MNSDGNDETTLEPSLEQNEEQWVDDEKPARLKLYISCALSFWGDRMWFFAVGLCFHYMNPDNFLLAAIYGLSNRVCIIIFSGPIGRWVDRSPRFKAASIFLTVQNGSVIICTTWLVSILITKNIMSVEWHGIFLLLGQCLVVAFASIGSAASVASSISVQRDWVKVIAGENKELLAAMNTTIRCIDLTSSILGPIAVGHIMVISPIFGAIFLAGWNFVSVFLEYYLLLRVYKEVPRLAIKPTVDSIENPNKPEHSKIVTKILKHYGGWQIYWNQEILLAGLGFSYLYMTVLVFDSITIAYSTSQGITENVMGILLAAGGISGVLGTLIYPHLRKCIGLDYTGFYGFTFETICLTLCVVSLWLPGSVFDPSYIGRIIPPGKNTPARNISGNLISNAFGEYQLLGEKVEHITIMEFNKTTYQSTPTSFISIYVLMSGIVLSRFGLWIADLSIHQEIQELVAGNELGAVCGIQSSLNQTFSLLKFILVAVVRWKETFGVLVMVSFTFVFFGWLSYTLFLRRRIIKQRPKKYELPTSEGS